MMKSAALCMSFVLIPLIVGCKPGKKDAMVDDMLHEAKAKFAPDRTTMVFDVKGDLNGSVLTLKGEVHNAELKEQLIKYLREEKGYQIVDSLTILPAASIGEKAFAVVDVSVANLRTSHKHSAEMATQEILGTPLNVLKEERGWLYVQTPDEYLGWVDEGITTMTKESYAEWSKLPKVIVTTEFGFTRQSKDRASQVVSDVVAGSILALIADAGSQFEVKYPDGRVAFLSKTDGEVLDTWLKRANDTPESIVATAKRFMGIPYLWGGTSSKGMDCSGFTKTVYFLNGVLLPRDASQQAQVGDSVDTGTEISNLQPGDLLFFGTKATTQRAEHATHVAISLGGKRFIHASGDVRINSLDPADSDYSEFREQSFLRAKRIIGAGEGIRRLSGIPYYHGNE